MEAPGQNVRVHVRLWPRPHKASLSKSEGGLNVGGVRQITRCQPVATTRVDPRGLALSSVDNSVLGDCCWSEGCSQKPNAIINLENYYGRVRCPRFPSERLSSANRHHNGPRSDLDDGPRSCKNRTSAQHHAGLSKKRIVAVFREQIGLSRYARVILQSADRGFAWLPPTRPADRTVLQAGCSFGSVNASTVTTVASSNRGVPVQKRRTSANRLLTEALGWLKWS
jgi:hypothetical protein